MQIPPDPRDEANWLELSKTYEHLHAYSDDGISPRTTSIELPNRLLKDKTFEWLKTRDGVQNLQAVWLAAFNIFYKNEGLGQIDEGGWRRCITIAGIRDVYKKSSTACLFLRQDSNVPKFYTQWTFNQSIFTETEEDQRSAYRKDPMNYEVVEDFTHGHEVTAFVAIRSKEISKEWERLDKKLTLILEHCMWKALVNAFPELHVDDGSGMYADISDAFDFLEIKVERVASSTLLRELIGYDFNDLFTDILNQPSNSKKQRSPSINEKYIHDGIKTGPVEATLATFLKSSGYLVIYEPILFLPTPEAEFHRNPDLMVFDKGRAIVVEIDDASHLIDLDNNKAPNVKKWHRDRIIDRELLCSGIPVLRVWHTEAREHPERVLTRIVQIFESLGGSRLQYQ